MGGDIEAAPMCVAKKSLFWRISVCVPDCEMLPEPLTIRPSLGPACAAAATAKTPKNRVQTRLVAFSRSNNIQDSLPLIKTMSLHLRNYPHARQV